MRYIRIIKTILFFLPFLFASCSEDLEGYMVNGNYLKIDNTDNGILNFSDDVTSRSVTITSKGIWNITSQPEWLDVSPISGDGTTTVSIKVTDYPSSDENRNDTICVKLNDLVSKIIAKQAASAYKFALSTKSLEFGANDSDAKTIQLTTNSNWSIVNNKGWCHVSPTEGRGNGELTVSCEENTTGKSRENIIEIKTPRETISVSINQSGNKFYLKTSPKNLTSFARTGGSQDIQILSNTDWMIISSEAWCSPSEIRGTGDKLISISATQNTLTTPRNATITISWADEELDINVTQERGEDPRLSVTPQTIGQVSNEGGSYTFTISSNVEWSVKSNKEWCHVDSPTEAFMGDGNFKITVDKNPIGSDARDAILTIKSAAGDKTIDVQQTAGPTPVLNIVPSTLGTLEYENTGGTQSFTIQSNIEWSVTCSDESWCHIVSPTSAVTGNREVKVKVDVNPAEAPERTCSLILKSSWFDNKTITVHQKKGDAGYVRVSNSTLSAKPQGEILTFDIESNLSNWTVSSNKDWCVVKTPSGSFNGKVELSVGQNSSSEALDATITIKSKVSDVIVTVHQEPKAIPGGEDNPNPSYSRKR